MRKVIHCKREIDDVLDDIRNVKSKLLDCEIMIGNGYNLNETQEEFLKSIGIDIEE